MAESRGGKEDRELKDSFERLWEQGTFHVDSIWFKKYSTSKKLKVKPKAANVAGLQIADLLAFPCRQKILAENGYIGSDLSRFTMKILEVSEDKFYRNPLSGKIIGHGRKMLP